MPLLPVLFIAIPFLELMILINLGSVMGLLPTLGLILTTAMVGYLLLRQQGLQIWQKVNEKLQQGELPSQDLLEGLVILIAGAFMITPGLITDTFGLLCLLPFTRHIVIKLLIKRFKGRVEVYSEYSVYQGRNSTNIYEGSAEDITEGSYKESSVKETSNLPPSEKDPKHNTD